MSQLAEPARTLDVTATAGLIGLIIVSYRTPDDVADCLAGLDELADDPPCQIFICENGGLDAWRTLCATVSAPTGPCMTAGSCAQTGESFTAVSTYRLRQSGRLVCIAAASQNRGYAGGINAWLLPLLNAPNWHGFWILNPDAVPDRSCLKALAESAKRRQLGMVGSRIMVGAEDERVRSKGLRWLKIRAITQAVGIHSAIATDRSAEMMDADIDAPSGASVFWTRACAEALVPLDERYFLYFEDLDWGIRATTLGIRIGYAHDAVIAHAGGRSLGSASSGPGLSRLAVYLEYRNRMLFVAKHFPAWTGWTFAVSCLRALRLTRAGALAIALRGLTDGMRRRTGRPDALLARHQAPGER